MNKRLGGFGVLLTGVLAGYLLGCAWKTYILYEVGQHFKNYCYGYKKIKLTKSVIWQKMLIQRFKEYIFLNLMIINPFSEILINVALFASGVCFGIMIYSAIAYLGIGGIGLFIASVMPQMPIYILAVLLMLAYYHSNDKNIRRTAMMIGITCVLIITGTFLESYINPYIIRIVLNQFCNII